MRFLNEYETVTCDECEGKGTVVAHYTCEGCGHGCSSIVECHYCEGAGTKRYQKTEFDPDCEYCAEGRVHPVWFYLPTIKVKRGGIKFNTGN